MSLARVEPTFDDDAPVASLSSAVPVRLSNHKAVLTLLGLFRQGAPLEAEEHGGRPDHVFFRWEGLNGGSGGVWVRKDDDQVLAAVRRAGHRTSLVVAEAILARAYELHGVEDQWRLERVVELLYGPRNPRRSRQRQLVPVRDLAALFERGDFVLDAKVRPKETTADRRARAKDKRNAKAELLAYGATVTGPLLTVERSTTVSATVHVAPELLGAMRSSQFTAAPAGSFRLSEPGHTNPHGNRPSLAAKARYRLGAHRLERMRRNNGQRVQLAELVRWSGLNEETITAGRRWHPHFQVALQELGRCGHSGGVTVSGPVAPMRRPRNVLLRLVHVAFVEEKTARRRGTKSVEQPETVVRPLGTATGAAVSTGPPRRPMTSVGRRPR